MDKLTLEGSEPGIIIRSPVPDDLAAVSKVHALAWRHGYQGLMPDDYLATRTVARSQELFAPLFAGPMAGWYVAIEPLLGLCGFICVGPGRDGFSLPPWEIFALNLVPKAWGRGIGMSLLNEALAYTAALGGGDVYLWVLEGNARGRRFYEKCGAKPRPETKAFRVSSITLTELCYQFAGGLSSSSL